jgi:hypothetical protein
MSNEMGHQPIYARLDIKLVEWKRSYVGIQNINFLTPGDHKNDENDNKKVTKIGEYTFD